MLRKFLDSTAGSNLIEFAVAAPVFLIIVIELFDLGCMMVVQNALDAGARAASRFGLTGATSGSTRQAAIQNQINQDVAAYSGGLINLNNLQVTVTAYPNLANFQNNQQGTTGSYGSGGQVVQYTIAYDWNSFLAIFGFPKTIRLSGVAAVQNENF